MLNFKLQFPFLKIMKIQKFPLNVVFKNNTDMEFIEALMEGLDRVFLVRGGGHEVVTIYS